MPYLPVPCLSPCPRAFSHSQQSAWWATRPDEPTDAHRHGKRTRRTSVFCEGERRAPERCWCSLRGKMAATLARLPLALGVAAGPARPWFPPPWPTAAPMLHPGNVALKFNTKWGNLVSSLVHVSGYGARGL